MSEEGWLKGTYSQMGRYSRDVQLATNRRRGGAVEGRGPLVRPDDAKRQTRYCG